jgi:hypothetical protein
MTIMTRTYLIYSVFNELVEDRLENGRRALGVASTFSVVKVDVGNAKPLREPMSPLEIIEQGPCEVAAYVPAVLFNGTGHAFQVLCVKFDTVFIIETSLGRVLWLR